MTKDIGDFDMDEAQSVYQKALRRAEIKYFNGDKVKLENVMASNGSIRAVAARVQGKEYDGELDDFAESINEILAQEIYISVKEGGEGRSFWPVIFPDSAEGRQYQYSVGPPTNREAPLVPNLARCKLQRDGDIYVADSIQESLFLASDSEHLFTSEGGNHLIWTQHFNSNLEVWVGVPVAKGRATGSLGAGRCDSVDEVDYRWMGNHDLGIALGLEDAQRIKPPEPETLSSITKSIKTVIPDRNEFYLKVGEDRYYLTNFPDGSEILYFKKFKKKNGAKRKNRPEDPKNPQCLKKKFKMTIKNIVREFEFSERKKKKKVDLAFSTKDRKSAAAVMLEQLKPFTDEPNFHELKFNTFTEGEVTTKKGMGSAKQFAQVLFPVGRDGIDFDQEWCHLRGHGDGGEEDASNFVSGSKHCNSEQLAIEEGQRLWTRETDYTLRAKITTYTQLLSVKEKDVKKVFDRLSNKLTKSGKNWLSPTGCEKLFKPANKSEIADKLFLLEFFNAQKVKPKMFSFVGRKRKYLFFSTGRPNSTLAFREDFLNKYKGMKEGCKKQLRDLKNDEDTTLSRLWKKILKVIELSYLGNFYPGYMRYKIELRVEDSEFVKVFDHVYNAQSESFDYNEFKILRTTVDRLIAEALDQATAYKARIQKKAPDYKIGNLRFYRDNKGEVRVEDTAAMEIVND